MTLQDIKEGILKDKLVVLFRRVPFEKIIPLSRAIAAAGIHYLEVTFDQSSDDPVRDFNRCVELIHEAVGDQLILGAGTVLTTEQVEAVKAAGGCFIISPCTDDDVIRRTKELEMLSMPGAMTPSEIVHAWKAGADIVKLFPADDLGYHYIWNIRGPLSHIPLMATGGINPETIPLFLKEGINAVGTGASIIKRDLLAADDYAAIQTLAEAHVKAIADYLAAAK